MDGKEYFEGLYSLSGLGLNIIHDPGKQANQFEVAQAVSDLLAHYDKGLVTRNIFRKGLSVSSKRPGIEALDTEILPSIERLRPLASDMVNNGINESTRGSVEFLLGQVHSYSQVYM